VIALEHCADWKLSELDVQVQDQRKKRCAMELKQEVAAEQRRRNLEQKREMRRIKREYRKYA
jgi:hypothetical protein